MTEELKQPIGKWRCQTAKRYDLSDLYVMPEMLEMPQTDKEEPQRL